MAKISAYTNGGTPANNDLFIVARSGSNVKLLYSAIVTALTAVFNGLYAAAANGVTNGDSHDHVGGDGAAIVEAAITLADNTTNNASTSAHGFVVKATAPAAGLINIVAIGNGETGYSNKALFDATTPQKVGTAATGTATTAARSDHVHGQASFINMGTGSTLTISGGAITVTESFHRIDTEGSAATDNLDTINGGSTGDLLILASIANARDPTLKDTTGNLNLAGDFTLSTIADTITLIKFPNGWWYEISRSDNA